MNESVFMPAPYKGVNELLPTAVIKSPFCQTLKNFNPTANGLTLRYGDTIYKTMSPAATSYILGLFQYGMNGGIFIAFQNKASGVIKIYDVDSGAVVYTTAAAASTVLLNSVFYDNTLFIYPVADTTLAPGIKYNGAAWAAVGYTGTGNFYPTAGNVFNHRQYMPQIGEAAYWYTPLDSPASGLCVKKDLTGIYSEKCQIIAIASTTISENTNSVTYQAFISDIGEVLFYSGSYPDGNDWGLVGRARISQPIDYQATILYNGDTLVMTDGGVVSLRDLFLTGSEEASSLTLSSEAQKSWTAMIKAIRVEVSRPVGPIFGVSGWFKIKGVYDAGNNRIVISFPRCLQNYGLIDGNYYFIFDTLLLSWFFHVSGGELGLGGSPVRLFNSDMIYYKNKVLLASSNLAITAYSVRVKEGGTSFMDLDNDGATEAWYWYETKLAPVPFKKDAVYTVNGVEVIIQSDLYAQTNYYLVADFGRQTTDPQTVNALTTSVQKPLVNIGITANFAQIKIFGQTVTAKTVGVQIYGFNVWYEAGEKGSR